MKIREIVNALETIAPVQLAADWDNVGLLIGDAEAEANKLMLCIDLTERVLQEARRGKVGMVMAYHPVIFRPISRLTVSDTPVAYAAARCGVGVYCTHTALDAAPGGTNDVLAEAMGLTHVRSLEPIIRRDACKVVVFTPPEDLSGVAEAAFDAGAGRIENYERCSFFGHGIGTFMGGPGTHPSIGRSGREQATEELRLELLVPKSKLAAVCSAIRAAHTYETPAIDVYPLDEIPEGCGLGRIGRLSRGVTIATLINRVKKAAGIKKAMVAVPARRRRGDGRGRLISTAACCAGSCGSLYRAAVAGGAGLYVTGEMRHHDAMEATQEGMTVVCLGHSNSERITLKRLSERIKVILPKLKVVLAAADVDPFEIV